MATPRNDDMLENVFGNSKLRHVKSELLDQKVYPYLNVALKELINELLDNSDIQRYQEELKKQKVLDNYEKKRIDKILLKEELGDDYVSSDNSQSEEEDDSEFGGKSKGTIEGKEDNADEEIENEGKSINSQSESEDCSEESFDDGNGDRNGYNESGADETYNKKVTNNKKVEENFNIIAEEDENTRRNKKKKEPFWTLGDNPFNPIATLGKKLKEMAINDLLARNKRAGK